ncbi:aldo/keto reductase [Fodinicurvata sp. EGI_FJ10296]|uniref:aldo/keto reductase n=1 Tax=Fodinicurvata sp. EGI_FJ10296 TaxID=3231908 RepID=UPI003456D870
MEYRTLGRSGLRVSTLCLGTMMFGGPTADDEAAAIVDSARGAGVNFIDTANSYTGGESERIVGRLIAHDRDAWILATKAGNPLPEMPAGGGVSRKWLLRALEGSLSRLGTDYLDIWYLHRHDGVTPLEEIVSTMGEEVRRGRIRYWGFSNFRAWQACELVRLADMQGVPRPIVCQPHYNALNRGAEAELFPACQHHGIGIAPYSPLARGVLTGKYQPGEQPDPDTRAGRGDKRMMEHEFREDSLQMAQTIAAHAEKRGMTPTSFAIRWALNSGNIHSIIAGPRTLAHWQSYLDALDGDFTAEDEALIDSLVPAGHASTPGFTDPKYPVIGRQPRMGGHQTAG